jgi:AraC-like DNA-binding protein
MRTDVEAEQTFLAADGIAARIALRALREAGVDATPLLAKAGINRHQLAEPPRRIAAEAQTRFLDLASRALADPRFGFHLAQTFDLRECGIIYYLMAASRDRREALSHLARYLAVSNESLQLHVTPSGDHTLIRVTYRLSRHTDRQFAEWGSVVLVRALRELADLKLSLQRVTYAHERAGDTSEYDRFFQCPVRFGDSDDCIALANATLECPLHSSDQFLLRVLVSYCEEALAKRAAGSAGLKAMIENAIARRLPNGHAHADPIAEELGLSTRTMARRLAEEGTSFAAVLDRLRHDLALRYLEDRDLTLNQIAWLLGYAEVTSFNHAFRRWTGQSPSGARRVAREGPHETASAASRAAASVRARRAIVPVNRRVKRTRRRVDTRD